MGLWKDEEYLKRKEGRTAHQDKSSSVHQFNGCLCDKDRRKFYNTEIIILNHLQCLLYKRCCFKH